MVVLVVCEEIYIRDLFFFRIRDSNQEIFLQDCSWKDLLLMLYMRCIVGNCAVLCTLRL